MRLGDTDDRTSRACSIVTATLYTPVYLIRSTVGWVTGAGSNKSAVAGQRLQSHIDHQDSRLKNLRDGAERHRSLATQAHARQDISSAKQEFRYYKQKLATIESLEKQNNAMRAQSMAVEQATATMEMAKVQKATLKVIKKSNGKKMVGGLLKDIDSASDIMDDMVDITQDIDAAMSEIGAGTTDDDLLDELNAMVAADNPTSVSVAVTIEQSEDDIENARLDRELLALQPLFPLTETIDEEERLVVETDPQSLPV